MTVSIVKPRPIENPPLARAKIVFSHPSEEEFARILDFYGIAWLYEPVTFPLKWDEQGHVLEAFTPDFYLIQEDLYVELTTLRQSLMRIKNRKIRRLKELYPEVNIKLWDRADFMRFLERFGETARKQELIGKEAMRG